VGSGTGTGPGLGSVGGLGLGHDHRSGVDLSRGPGPVVGAAGELPLDLVQGPAHLLEAIPALALGPGPDPLRVLLGVADDLRRPFLGLGDDRAHPVGHISDDLLSIHGLETTASRLWARR
jgi:hypothetical protein